MTSEAPDSLEAAVCELRDEADGLRRELRRDRRWFIFVLVVVVLVGGGVMLDSRRQIAESNRRWCPVAMALAPRPGEPQPAGDAEQKARAQGIRNFFGDMARDWCR